MVILGLGSNTGDRQAYLAEAVHELAALLQRMRASCVFESAALLPPGAPEHWGHPFLNMAVAGETALSPEALFAEVKSIERKLGRMPRGVWAPREIDIDILAMDERVVETPVLAIPHRELLNRDFALLPLVQLAPQWTYPRAGEYQGKTAADIVRAKGFAVNERLRDMGAMIDVAA